ALWHPRLHQAACVVARSCLVVDHAARVLAVSACRDRTLPVERLTGTARITEPAPHLAPAPMQYTGGRNVLSSSDPAVYLVNGGPLPPYRAPSRCTGSSQTCFDSHARRLADLRRPVGGHLTSTSFPDHRSRCGSGAHTCRSNTVARWRAARR